MTDLADQNEIDVDSLLSEIEAPSPERAMSSEGPAAAPQEATPTPSEYEYEWRGQKIKEPLDLILKRASMGRDYNHLMEGFNKEKSTWETQRKEYDQKFSRYKEVDEFVKTNPDWWSHVEQSWNSREKPAVDANIKPLLEELNGLKSAFSEIQQERQQIKYKAEDEKLAQDIQGIRKQYADLPWDSPDETGRTLEYRVIEHANKNGIPTFKAAFLDLNHDLLEKRWESRGREAVVKDTQKKTKLGLLGETQAPTKGLKSAQGVKGRSYDDLTREALEELGIT